MTRLAHSYCAFGLPEPGPTWHHCDDDRREFCFCRRCHQEHHHCHCERCLDCDLFADECICTCCDECNYEKAECQCAPPAEVAP